MDGERQIFAQIKAGNNAAFSYIYKEYYADLCIYASNYFFDQEDVKNVVQDVIMSLWENRSNIEKIQVLRPYLFRAVHYQCLNHLKRRKVKEKYNDETAYNLKMLALETEDILESNEQVDEIMHAIEKLPEQTKLVFKMKRFEQLSYKEIALKLGISDRTVDTHMTKAMRRLKELLGHYLSILFFVEVSTGFLTLYLLLK